MQVTEADLRLAYQDTDMYRALRWPFEKAIAVPGVPRILERLAQHREQRIARANSHAVQPRLI